MTATRSISDYAKQINTCWRKTTESVLETGSLCAEAKNSVGENNKALIKKLDFSAATFSKLVTIGERRELYSSEMKARLPSNYTIVYELAKLSEDDLKRAVNEGVVKPAMTRATLQDWRGVGSKVSDEHEVVFGTLLIPVDYDMGMKKQLEAELDKLKAKFAFEFERPRDPLLEERIRLEKKFDQLLRSRARAHIRDLRARQLGPRSSKLSREERSKRWPYGDDEIKIADDASAEDVRVILSKVGSADHYKRIFDEVRRICGSSEAQVEEHPTVDHDEALREILEASQQAKDGTEKTASSGHGATVRH